MAGRKRGNGEGSKPRKRLDGRCEGPYYDAAGQRKTVYGNSHKEVAGQLAQGLTTKDDIAEFQPTTITVQEFFGQYDEVARDTMKRRSFETYRSIARKRLLPAWDSAKLRELNREQVQRCTSASAMLASPLVGYAGFTVSYRRRSTRL